MHTCTHAHMHKQGSGVLVIDVLAVTANQALFIAVLPIRVMNTKLINSLGPIVDIFDMRLSAS